MSDSVPGRSPRPSPWSARARSGKSPFECRETVGRILARDNGQRYYDWRLDAEGQLQCWENANCAAERRREGHWLLETEETAPSAVEAVQAY